MSNALNERFDPNPIIRHMGSSIVRILPKPCISPYGQITAYDRGLGDKSSRMSETEDGRYDAVKLRLFVQLMLRQQLIFRVLDEK